MDLERTGEKSSIGQGADSHPLDLSRSLATSLAAPLAVPLSSERPAAMDFSDWAARPAPKRDAAMAPARDALDLGALKIFLILAGLTAGMALALRSLF